MPPKAQFGVLSAMGQDKRNFSFRSSWPSGKKDKLPLNKLMPPKTQWGVLLLRGQDKANF